MKYRMGVLLSILLLTSNIPVLAQSHSSFVSIAHLNHLPVYNRQKVALKKDWLIKRIHQKAQVFRTANNHLILSNGLISREFTLTPNGATIGFENLMTGANLLRSVRPEARVDINGIWFDIGGLKGQPVQAYFRPLWLDSMRANPKAWKLTGYRIGKIKARLK